MFKLPFSEALCEKKQSAPYLHILAHYDVIITTVTYSLVKDKKQLVNME
jgi:hypothetical protein